MSTELNKSSAWAMAAAEHVTHQGYNWSNNYIEKQIDRNARAIERHAEPEFSKLRAKLAGRDLDQASMADFVNTHARECGTKEAKDACLSRIKQAIDDIVFSLRAKQIGAESKLAEAQAVIAELRKAKERLATIRQLMGYTHEGSIQTVTLSQDDATGDYFIKAGDFWAIDKSFTALLDSAQKKAQP